MAHGNNSGPVNGFTPYESILNQHEGDRVYASVDPAKMMTDAEDRARASADEIVRKVQDEADETRQKGYDEGYNKGSEEGLAEVRQKYSEALARLKVLMQEVETKCSGAAAQFAEEEILELVKVMVERLVSHEVSVNSRVISATLQKALGYVVENSEVKVSLNPDDFNRLKESGLEETVLLEGLSRIQLVEDPSIEPGGCQLDTDFGEIDATLSNRREKLYKAVDQAFMSSLSEASPGVLKDGEPDEFPAEDPAQQEE